MSTWSEIITTATVRLTENGIEEATTNAEYLAAHALRVWKRAELRAFLGQTPSPSQLRIFEEAIARRITGEPLQYIIGETEFYGLRLFSTPAALIPRPETEILVEEALAQINRLDRPCRILDIGTGSGAIALALAHRSPDSNIVGIDISEEAVKLAISNKTRLGLTNVGFRVLNFPTEVRHVSGPFDLIVSNPPYIPLSEMERLSKEVRTFEPVTALTDKSDGFSFYEAIAANARALLSEDGVLLVETEYKGAARVREIFGSHGLTILSTATDLLGHERVVVTSFL